VTPYSRAVGKEGELLADVSNAIVGIFAECYGRGPTKAKSYMFDDYLVTVLDDLLTTVETTLVENGRENLVREVRVTFQEAVADRFKNAVTEVIGRKVLTYHSQVTFHPARGFEIFVLEPEDGEQEP
jgi:uncharacterized protein YbcI